MKQIKILTLIVVFLTSCSSNMVTTNDLKPLNLKGNVKKVELITQTSIPVSEWFYTGIDFDDYNRKCRRNAIYTFVGNSSIQFSESGTIHSQTVYSNDGSILFEGLPLRDELLTLYQPINIKVKELSDGWDFEYDNNARIVRQTTSHDGKMFLDRKIEYNENGDIAMVTCNYAALNMDNIDYQHTDTTFFTYSNTDSCGNWTKATIEHKGRLSSDSYKMKIKRQITYFGKEEKKALIDELKSWNKELEEMFSQDIPLFVKKDLFDNDISVSIPEQMEICTSYNVPDGFLYQLPNSKGFFNITVTKVKQNGSIFENEVSTDIYDAMSYMLGQNGTVVVKWLGYSNNETLNNEKCLKLSYAFYSRAGYLNTGIPGIIETFGFQPDGCNIVYTVTIGYNSNQAYLYKPWVEKIKSSIIINQ